jgi:hypothetical protein
LDKRFKKYEKLAAQVITKIKFRKPSVKDNKNRKRKMKKKN